MKHEYTKSYSPEPDGPIIALTWFEAMQYCNWLSVQEGLPDVIPPEAWAGGLAAAVLIGALAGLLPAIRAARLSPTQALLTV